ncbi:hypothetical protein ALC56_11448, partial [Trachymyrmex septentrionalis]
AGVCHRLESNSVPPAGRPATPRDTPRAGTMLLSEAGYPPLCLVQPPTPSSHPPTPPQLKSAVYASNVDKASTRYSPPSRIYAILKARSSIVRSVGSLSWCAAAATKLSYPTIDLGAVSETFRNGISNDLTRVRCRYCEIRRSARRWLYTAPRGKGRGYGDEE